MTVAPSAGRRAFEVVDMFEQAIADYCLAPYAVAVDSGTNALLLALRYAWNETDRPVLQVPRQTYVGVVQAAFNAGWHVELVDKPWVDLYRLEPSRVVDAAVCFRRGVHLVRTLTCLSFQAGKRLPLGRGGAVLCDTEFERDWLREKRADGRPPGGLLAETTQPGWHCYMPPDVAARGLWLLPYVDRELTNSYVDYEPLDAVRLIDPTWV